MANSTTIGICAPSSRVPQVELGLGVRKLQEDGFNVLVHPQVRKKHLSFAGTLEERVKAFVDLAKEPLIDVIWCARGGYGATYLLPELKKAFRRPPPKKLLVGFSDITALHEFVRNEWGWKTLHAPMPANRPFSVMPSSRWKKLKEYTDGDFKKPAVIASGLRFLGKRPAKTLQGKLVGGNLAVLHAMVGGPFWNKLSGKILFLEEIGESPNRVERMLVSMEQAGAFKGVRAVVLGDFSSCVDGAPMVLKKKLNWNSRKKFLPHPMPFKLRPLRPTIPGHRYLDLIFTDFSSRTGITVAKGLHVGHEDRNEPLPLGGSYILNKTGQLTLQNW